MKLLFLCTSLEPGRDGVGDYVRLLADACIDAGHTCSLLALNDSFVTSACVETQTALQHEIPCLRLPAMDTWAEKKIAAQTYTNEFSPTWLSWQLVPYGFHPKGVIPKDVRALSKLGAGRGNHVLLHELWIGLSRGEPWKNRFWGVLQRKALNKFITKLNTIILHTTNTTYQKVLAREKWPTEILPLFGNIPIVQTPTLPANQQSWAGGIFGTVHPQFEPKRCFDRLVAGARLSQRKLRILGIGRLGEYGEKMFADLEKSYPNQIEASVLGEKSPTEISLLLQALDFGIATHPWALAGKSGAVAAMLDHGLPVIVPRNDWTLRRNPFLVPSIDPLMTRLSDMPPELMAGRLAWRQPAKARLPGIAATFLASLEAASVRPMLEP